MTDKTGGSAFPNFGTEKNVLFPQGGMSLRDWFAGVAMQGILINDPDWTDNEVAKTAYELADEMLKVRDKK